MDNEKNNKQQGTASRHTWIGEEERLTSTDRMVWTDESDVNAARVSESDPVDDINIAKTRIVERQKKPYSGFITDEELKNSDIFTLDDKKTRIISKEDILKTQVYPPFNMPEEEETESEEPEKPKARTLVIADKSKFKRLVAVLAVFALLILFELSFVWMKYAAGAMPAKTESIRTETAELQEENKKLEEESAEYGEIDQVRELKESWERLKEKLEQ